MNKTAQTLKLTAALWEAIRQRANNAMRGVSSQVEFDLTNYYKNNKEEEK